MIEALYCRLGRGGWWLVHWWLVGGCCRLLVGSWWSICRSSRGPSFRAGQRQGNGRATRQGGNAGVGAGPGHKPSTKLDITSDGWINSRLNLLTRFFHPRSALSTSTQPTPRSDSHLTLFSPSPYVIGSAASGREKYWHGKMRSSNVNRVRTDTPRILVREPRRAASFTYG